MRGRHAEGLGHSGRQGAPANGGKWWLAAKGHTKVTLTAWFWLAVFLRRQSRTVWTRQRYTPAFARAR
jgi:hypothetical protein